MCAYTSSNSSRQQRGRLATGAKRLAPSETLVGESLVGPVRLGAAERGAGGGTSVPSAAAPLRSRVSSTITSSRESASVATAAASPLSGLWSRRRRFRHGARSSIL